MIEQLPTTVSDDMISRRELPGYFGVSSSTISRWIASGLIPKPDIKVSRKAQWWSVDSLCERRR